MRVLLLKKFDQSGDLEVNVLPQDRGSLLYFPFNREAIVSFCMMNNRED